MSLRPSFTDERLQDVVARLERHVEDRDQWLSDFMACYAHYLMHLYPTGEKLPCRSFCKDHQPIASAAALPEFTPNAWR